MTQYRIALVILACALGFSVAPSGADEQPDVAKEMKKFAGSWTIESSTTGGTEIPAEQLKGFVVIYEGDKHTLKHEGKVFQVGTQKIDPAKSPKTIDVTMTEGPQKGAVMLGIYEIDGDTMKVCFDPTGKKRPTEFKSPEGSQTFLNVHKRVKK